jgi:hypothetical protein
MTSGSAFVLFSVFCFAAGVWRHLSRPTSANARRSPHTSGDISLGQRHSWDGFDCGANRHLARPELVLAARHGYRISRRVDEDIETHADRVFYNWSFYAWRRGVCGVAAIGWS